MSDLSKRDGDSGDLAARYRAMFDGLGEQEIIAKIQQGWAQTLDGWMRMAYGIEALEKLGLEVNRIRAVVSGRALNMLRRLAGGQLCPDLLTAFPLDQSLITVVGRLPMPDQKMIAAGGRLAVLVPGGGSGYTSRMLTVGEMRPDQRSQVLAPDHIRSESEQAAWLDARAREAALPVPEFIGKFRIDRETGEAVFTGKRGDRIDAKTLRAVLGALER